MADLALNTSIPLTGHSAPFYVFPYFFLTILLSVFCQVMCYVYFVEWCFRFSYLIRFWNISCFLLSSFSEISNGHYLSSIVFPSLIAHLPLSKVILIMLLQSPMNFLMCSSFLSSGSGFFDSGSSNTMFLLQFSLSFS